MPKARQAPRLQTLSGVTEADQLPLVALDSAGADKPPAEFKVFSWGDNATTKGTLVLDRSDASEIIDAYNEHGVDGLAMDYDHASHVEGKSAPAAAWLTPELRDDGLWVKADWTKRALKKIAAREYRFTSPAVRFDEKTRHIKQLLPFGLLNFPAQKNQKPLVAGALSPDGSDGSDDTTTTEVPTMKTLLSALGLADTTDEPSAVRTAIALTGMQRDVLALTGAPTAPEAVGILTAWKATTLQLSAITAERDKIAALLAARDIDDAIAKAQRDGKIANGDTALLETARKLGASGGMLALGALIDALPVKVQPAGTAGVHEKAPVDTTVALSALDVEFARGMGNDPKAVAAHAVEMKAARAAARGA